MSDERLGAIRRVFALYERGIFVVDYEGVVAELLAEIDRLRASVDAREAERLDAIQEGLCVAEVRGTSADWPIIGFDVYWPEDDATVYTAPTIREAIDKALVARASLRATPPETTTQETKP